MRPLRISALLLPLLFMAAESLSQHAPADLRQDDAFEDAVTTPEKLGFSSERLRRIDRHLEHHVGEGNLVGAVALVLRNGRTVYEANVGMMDRETRQPMRSDAIFRMASMTKPIVSAAVMMLYEDGHFLLNEPVSRFIPEFKDPVVVVEVNAADSSFTSEPARREITIRDLLRHTSGITYGLFGERLGRVYRKADIPDAWDTRDITIGDKMRALAKLPLAHHPGDRFTYGLNTDVLGYLIEVISGMPLDRFLSERIFTPLGMSDTYFYLPPEKADRLAALYALGDDGRLKRYTQEMMNANGWHASPDYPIDGARTYFSGGGGLVSTASDYARFLQMLLDGGELDGVRLLSPKSVQLMTVDHVSSEDASFGLGFGVRRELGRYGELGSEGTYDWSGYWGTSFWVDPQENLIGIFLSQANPPGYNNERFRVLVYQAVAHSASVPAPAQIRAAEIPVH